MSLETDLRDLGAHLDHPDGVGIDAAVRAARTGTRSHRRRWVLFAAVAAVLLVGLALPLVFGGFGGDGADVSTPRRSRHPQATTTTTSTPPPPVIALGLADARAAVQFPIRVPQGLVPPSQVLVDRRVPGGLVALRYPAFTLVELPSPANASVMEVTSADAASRTHPMEVRGQPALWITGGAPEIGYLDRTRALHRAPTRTGGHVLVWVEQGVTYRIEGFAYQSSAMAMANAIT